MSEPEVVRRAALTYCALPVRVTMDSLASEVPAAVEELERYMASRGIQPSGTSLIRYRTVSSAEPFVIDVGWVTEEDIWIDAPFVADVCPAGTYVELAHQGPFAELTAATARALHWGASHDVQFDTQPDDAWACWYELYESDPIDGPTGPEGVVRICLKLRDDT